MNFTTQINEKRNTLNSPPPKTKMLHEKLELLVKQISLSCGFSKSVIIGEDIEDLSAALRHNGHNIRGLNTSCAMPSQSPSLRIAAGSVLTTSFKNDEFNNTIVINCLEYLHEHDIPKALGELHRICNRYMFLHISNEHANTSHRQQIEKNRAWWESLCFEAGFRKHFLYYRINGYEALEHDGPEILILLEKIPKAANQQYPLTALKEERDLHMDMLRESGSRSDAHVARYNWASKYIRPGDVVLDAASGLGYGSYVLASLTEGSKFVGIDGSSYATNYAASNFAIEGKLSFTEGYLPQCLKDVPNDSIDTVVSFETLEHVEDPVALLNEFYRILTPGGRLICSVPNDWSDESGNDPNPFHLHVYNQNKFLTQLNQKFDLESIVGQTADRVKKLDGSCEWMKRPRSFTTISLDANATPTETEWLLGVAAKSPFPARPITYIEKCFSKAECSIETNALAFERDYENPWLIRSIISIGLRTENRSLRARWAQQVLSDSPKTSADFGAALCVLAYLELDKPIGQRGDELVKLADNYLQIPIPTNPNVLRWQVSLAYVFAIWAMEIGDIERAKALFQYILQKPIYTYSATLLTKSVCAAHLLGTIYLAEGNNDQAQSVWASTFRDIQQKLAQTLLAINSDYSPSFQIPEITSVVAILGRLRTSICNAKNATTQPSLYLDAVDSDLLSNVNRIQGLVTRIQGLEDLISDKNREYANIKAYTEEVALGKLWLEDQWKNLTAALAQRESELLSIKKKKIFRILRRINLL